MSFKIWLEFEEWVGEEDSQQEDCFNMTVTLDDGREYALNIWTYGFWERALLEHDETADDIEKEFMEPPDLFVASMDRSLIEKVVAKLLEEGRMLEHWLVEQ